MLTTWQFLSSKFGTNFADKRMSLGRYIYLADAGDGVCSCSFILMTILMPSHICFQHQRVPIGTCWAHGHARNCLHVSDIPQNRYWLLTACWLRLPSRYLCRFCSEINLSILYIFLAISIQRIPGFESRLELLATWQLTLIWNQWLCFLMLVTTTWISLRYLSLFIYFFIQRGQYFAVYSDKN
jgi:hypothetical protein